MNTNTTARAKALLIGALLGVALVLGVAAACAPDETPVVTYGEWVTGNFQCGDTTAQITRTGTSTLDGHTETFYQTETVDLTAEQLASLDCEAPAPAPEPTPEPEPTAPPATCRP